VIISTNYDVIDYQDFGFDINKIEITIYYTDGTKKIEILKGGILKLLKLYDDK
jgi:hypothetical protein